MNTADARRQFEQLHKDLSNLIQPDPEQEVRYWAVPVVDAVMSGVRAVVEPDHPVLQAVTDLISPSTIQEGEPIRAADALIVVGQLLAALPLTRSHSSHHDGWADCAPRPRAEAA